MHRSPFVLCFALLVSCGCSLVGIRTEETPKYQVLSSSGKFEIRTYAPQVVAQTTVKGDFEESQKAGFKILAGYIFGKNARREKIQMTAPVTQAPAESEKIAMTAPVTMTSDGDGHVMTFSMPPKYTLETLPTPTDPRVKIEQVPARTFGVIRFTGLWRDEKNREKAKELVDWIVREGEYEITSKPIFAGYNPPWTIPFLRRNEVMVELRKKKRHE